MGAAGSVEATLANVPDKLTQAECMELARSHNVEVKDTLFRILSNKEGKIPKPAVIRYCQLNAIAAGGPTSDATSAAGAAPPAPKKDAREMMRRVSMAKGGTPAYRAPDGKKRSMGGGARPEPAIAETKASEPVPKGRGRKASCVFDSMPKRKRQPTVVEQRLRSLVDNNAALQASGAAGRYDHQLLDADEEAARREKHAQALRMQAEEAMARFNELPLSEQKLAKNDGSLEMYTPENLEGRMNIRSSPTVESALQKWWKASARYDDKDRDGALNKVEYAGFHKRLLGLFEVMGLDHPISEDEGRELMEQDFELDSGGDGLVNEEKFLYSIFQLADQWTDSIDAEHYCAFLHNSYDIVYKEMIESDAIRPPEEWREVTRTVKSSDAAWSNAKVVEFMAEMYRLKIAANEGSKKTRGMTLCKFVLAHMVSKFGPDEKKGYGKHLQELTNTILAVIEKPPTMGADKGGLQIFSWMLLFAQLVGFHTLSSRLVALPEKAAVYVLDVIDKCRPLLDPKLPTNELRDCMTARENEGMVGYIKVDKARVLMANLLKNSPFDKESAAFGQAMESAFRSIVLHIANVPVVEMAEFLTLVAAGFVATQCPTLVNEGESKE